MLKRQVYHAMFLEQNPDDPFETIAYNDSEHMDHYNGLSKAYADFYNSGLATTGNLSFKEFLELPCWFADWLVEDWGRFVAKRDNKMLEDQIQAEMDKAKENASGGDERPPKKTDPWANNY